jgi:hypothetical protein
MSHELKDAAHEPVDPLFMPAFRDMEDYDPMNIAGPGGKTTNIENNEKGILESGLFRVMSHHTEASLGSDHDSYAQGIYTSHHGTEYGD